MVNTDYFIKIEKEWFRENGYLSKYNEHGLVLYMIASKYSFHFFDYCLFNFSDLLIDLNLTVNNNPKQISQLKESLNNMIEDDFINLVREGKEVKDFKSMQIQKNYKMYYNVPRENDFAKIYFEDIDKLLQIKSVNKFKVYALYLKIICLCNSGGDVAIITSKELEKVGVDKRTLSKYIDILEENKLIAYCSGGFNKETQKECPNYYARYSDLPTLKKRLEEYGGYDNLRAKKKERDSKRKEGKD